ncbi:hypothetical protein ACFZAU_35225 [Streptomyces sp. NPDC008238]
MVTITWAGPAPSPGLVRGGRVAEVAEEHVDHEIEVPELLGREPHFAPPRRGRERQDRRHDMTGLVRGVIECRAAWRHGTARGNPLTGLALSTLGTTAAIAYFLITHPDLPIQG